MKVRIILIALIVCINGYSQNKSVISENLEIVKLTENAFLHVSYMEAPAFGRFSCNGLIYLNNNEAVFIDTPPDTVITIQLLDWFMNSYPDKKITGIIITHFHDDCLGGLTEFHKRGIKSYSHELTPRLAADNKIPQIVFKDKTEITTGNERVICRYFGEAHTIDNIVAWIPGEKILFGGCMVKSLNSSKGNLADANVNEWANTVKKIKEEFISAEIVIPGHGNTGGTELLDYTLDLFAPEDE
jgi:metallo-beta-lactamase class B